jgi:hypothetical protein
MLYSDHKSLDRALSDFRLVLREVHRLFENPPLIEPSQRLKDDLAEGLELATGNSSEKSRSELILSRVLLEIRRLFPGKVSYFSGLSFNVDESQNLVGVCDFILGATGNQMVITALIVTIVEAKDNDLKVGMGQCVAEMVAAQVVNTRAGEFNPVYGVVSTGTNWKFLMLKEQDLTIDRTEYFINQIDLVLGILSQPFRDYFA